MVVREWLIEAPAPHKVRVEHWWVFSGKARVWLDGEMLWERSHKMWDVGFEYRFKLDGVPCLVRVLYRTWTYEYELWVDGKLQ